MKPGSIQDWLKPTLGGVLMVVGAAGLAYKVISGYRHPSPDAFVSVQDQNKLAAAAEHPVAATAAPVDVAAPAQSTINNTPPAPSIAAPSVEAGTSADVHTQAQALDNSACVAIQTEQHEIEGALRRPPSSEESRYLQRRQLELAEQSSKTNCDK